MTVSPEIAERPELGSPGAPASMTAEQFIVWPQPEGGLTEWLDGWVIVHGMPKEVHQRIAGLPNRP